MLIERLKDETDFEYHKRLVYGKLVDKTLSDVDYTELAKHLYGKDYSSDVARRMCYGSRFTLDLIDKSKLITDSKDVSSDTVLEAFDEIDIKMSELKRERQKFFDQRREFNKLVNREGRAEHLYDELIKAANKLDTLERFEVDSNINELDKSEAVLVFSDWHYGQVSDNCFNIYNRDICIERVRATVVNTIKRIKLHGCNTLHIVVLGDLINGAIHTSSRVASEELVCEQLMQASEILANAINELSSYVNTTKVCITYGNHARVVQNKADSIHNDNLERIIPWWLKERFSDRNDVEIVDNYFNDEIIRFTVLGNDMCAVHGDLDSVKSSPRLLTTLLMKTNGMNLKYVILGDKHHHESFNELGVTATICGSLCGADNYARDKRLYSEPSQLLLIVNKHGVDAEYKIKCDLDC